MVLGTIIVFLIIQFFHCNQIEEVHNPMAFLFREESKEIDDVLLQQPLAPESGEYRVILKHFRVFNVRLQVRSSSLGSVSPCQHHMHLASDYLVLQKDAGQCILAVRLSSISKEKRKGR